MASITVILDCTLQEDGGASISVEITEATAIPTQLLLHKVGSVVQADTYSGVATPWEIATYPTVRNAQLPFYRKATATLDYDNLAAAQKAKAELSTLLGDTVQAYADLGTFVGEFEVEIESE